MRGCRLGAFLDNSRIEISHSRYYDRGCRLGTFLDNSRMDTMQSPDRTGLGSTTLHYLTVWHTMASVHRPIHLLTLANWPLHTPERMWFEKKLPERAPTKTWLRVLSIINRSHWRSGYTQLSPLYLIPTLYIIHMTNYSTPPTAFPYCKWWKAG